MRYMQYDQATELHANGTRGLLPHSGNKHWTPAAGFSSQLTNFTDADEELMNSVVGLEPGDAVVHHCQVIHAGHPNTTEDKWRRAVAFVVCREDCVVKEEGMEQYRACVATSAANDIKL